MNTISREIILRGGYVISNSFTTSGYDEEAWITCEDENYGNPAIQTSIINCCDIEGLISVFREAHIDDLPEKWYNAFWSERPWKLSGISIECSHITFFFVSPLLRERRKKLTEEERIHSQESSGYAMVFYDNLPERCSFELEFKVPTPTGGTSITVVEIGNGHTPTITKQIPYGDLTYELLGPVEGAKASNSNDRIKAHLTECYY